MWCKLKRRKEKGILYLSKGTLAFCTVCISRTGEVHGCIFFWKDKTTSLVLWLRGREEDDQKYRLGFFVVGPFSSPHIQLIPFTLVHFLALHSHEQCWCALLCILGKSKCIIWEACLAKYYVPKFVQL